MGTVKKISFAFLIALSLSLITLSSVNATNGLSLLRSPDGNFHSINEYANKGKWLVVMFWAYDCSACNNEAQSYNELHDRRKNKDLELLGVSVDGWNNREKSKDFIKKHHLNFPNLIGGNEEVSALFERLSGRQLVGTPGIFIYNPEGELMVAEIGAVPVSLIEKFISQQAANQGQ